MDEVFHALLVQARRREIIRTKGRPKYPKPPVARYPVLLERKYAAYLQRLLAPLAKIGNNWARTQYAQALQDYRRTDSDDLHQDADSHALVFSLMEPLQQAQLAMDLEAGGAAAMAMGTTAEGVNAWVAKRFALERQLALGAVYQPSEPWVQAALAEWVETNRKLVKSLSGEALTRMESMVLEAIQTGQRPEELVPRIHNLNRSTGIHRARLIAADQIGKLQGLLTEQRSLAIGMDTYIWQTAMDERVRGNPRGKYPTARPSHWAAQGKVGVFGKGDVWVVDGKQVPRRSGDPVGAPGMEIRCRCVSLSRWEDLLKPIDEGLLMDPYVRAEMGLAPWPE